MAGDGPIAPRSGEKEARGEHRYGRSVQQITHRLIFYVRSVTLSQYSRDGVISMTRKLKGAMVWRGGVTARSMTFETSTVELQVTKPGKGVLNIFNLASKGGGETRVEYKYDAEDYPAHLQMMVLNDPNAALVAMSAIIHEHIVALPVREAEVAQRARREIVAAANGRWLEATGTDEAVAKIVQAGLNAIVAKIEEADEENEAA